jgi:hypothetical protein
MLLLHPSNPFSFGVVLSPEMIASHTYMSHCGIRRLLALPDVPRAVSVAEGDSTVAEWTNECINGHGFMDRVQSVTYFISSVQTRVTEGSSIVNFYHASRSLPSCVTAVGCQGYADRFHRYWHSPHTLPRHSACMWTWSYWDATSCIIIRCLHQLQDINVYVEFRMLLVSCPKM